MEGLKGELIAIARQAKADGDRAKNVIEKVYGAVFQDVRQHNDRIKASFGKKVSAFDSRPKYWRGLCIAVLTIGVLVGLSSVGSLTGGRSNGGIHRVR
jgi:hypothetical protein